MLLTSIFSILVLSLLTLFFMPNRSITGVRIIALITSGLVLVLSCMLLVQFDCNSYYFQNVVNYSIGSQLINLCFSFGIVGISIFFFVLTSFLIFLCILFVWNDILFKEYALNLLLIELLLLLVFFCIGSVSILYFF